MILVLTGLLMSGCGSADYAFRSDDSGATWESYHPAGVDEEKETFSVVLE